MLAEMENFLLHDARYESQRSLLGLVQKSTSETIRGRSRAELEKLELLPRYSRSPLVLTSYNNAGLSTMGTSKSREDVNIDF